MKMPKRRTVQLPVCIDPDLANELARAEQDAEPDEEKPGRLSNKPVDREALEARYAEAFETLTLQALPRHRWRELVEEHPPREDNIEDYGEPDRFGRHDGPMVNSSTFFPVVVPESIVAPDASAATWEEWLAELSDGEWARICSSVFALNRSYVNAPKSLTASSTTPTRSGE